MQTGFIGLGHMGLPMAMNLIKKGFTVTGFDLQKEALQALVQAGGNRSHSAIELAKDKEIVITMLQTPEQLKRVCLGDEGIYACMKKGSLHIDCSTIDVTTSRELHQQAAKSGLQSLDAPVSGGVKGAAAGSLTFMAGGDEEAFIKASKALEAMGKNIFHAGSAGSGQAAKLCNNMILGISMIAVSEAFVLAEKLDLPKEKLFEIVKIASGQCWAISNYVPVPDLLPDVPANHGYQPGFTAAMMLKDLRLSQQAARESSVQTAMGRLAMDIYHKFDQNGHGQLDFSAIIQAISDSAVDKG